MGNISKIFLTAILHSGSVPLVRVHFSGVFVGSGNDALFGSGLASGDLRTEKGKERAFERLLQLTDEQLGQLDIALVNLLCATGLPSTDPLDVPQCLQQLDEWAEYARQEIIKGYPRYRANPDPNKGSENVYRFWMLMHAIRVKSGLEERLRTGKGVKNRGVIDDSVKPTGGPYANRINSQVGFVHGLLSPRCLGCCSSDPVLFAAIGRRLGYPIKLVITVQHVFNRWVDDIEQFNMDGSMKWIGSDEDHHYIDRWRPWLPAERAALNKTLHVPLTPRQELAAFMFERSICLSANLRFREAHEACEIARQMSPENPAYVNELDVTACNLSAQNQRSGITWLRAPTPKFIKAVLPPAGPWSITPSQQLEIYFSRPLWSDPSIRRISRTLEY